MPRNAHGAGDAGSRKRLDGMLQSYIQSLPVDRRCCCRAAASSISPARSWASAARRHRLLGSSLLQGIDADDPLFLQVQAGTGRRSSRLMPIKSSGSKIRDAGPYVGQRLAQDLPDIFLGWGEGDGVHFYVRQLADMKGSIEFNESDSSSIDGFVEYCCALCGWALALAHAKSGDPAMIAGYCGNSDALDDSIGKFALAYAKQTG